MKALASSLIILIMALWVVAIALIAVQNVFIFDDANQPVLVSLRFMGQTSIALPFGLILAISTAVGMLITSLMVFVLPQIMNQR